MASSKKSKPTSPAVTAFTQGIAAFETHNRPADYPGLTAETRRKANAAQFDAFAQAYWPEWRYVKVRLYRRLLEERDDICLDLPKLLPQDPVSPRSRVYQDLTNGLLASAAAEVCQYAEDLAALLHALASKSHFVRDLLSFSAGKIQNDVKGWPTLADRDICKLFHVPIFDTNSLPESEFKTGYGAGVQTLRAYLETASTFYRRWFLHHIRYKHGLAFALAPFAREVGPEIIERRSKNLRGLPVAFDCGTIAEALQASYFHGVISLPNVAPDDIRLNVVALAGERNLLMYVNPPLSGGQEPGIEELEAVAKRIAQLQRVALANYFRSQSNSKTKWSAVVPAGEGYGEIRSL